MKLVPRTENAFPAWGPVFGAVLYSAVQDQITSIVRNPYLPALIYGVLLILIVMFAPPAKQEKGESRSEQRAAVRWPWV